MGTHVLAAWLAVLVLIEFAREQLLRSVLADDLRHGCEEERAVGEALVVVVEELVALVKLVAAAVDRKFMNAAAIDA